MAVGDAAFVDYASRLLIAFERVDAIADDPRGGAIVPTFVVAERCSTAVPEQEMRDGARGSPLSGVAPGGGPVRVPESNARARRPLPPGPNLGGSGRDEQGRLGGAGAQ